MEENFTYYDIKPADFLNYLRYYGPHFNYNLCEFACKQFKEFKYSKNELENLFNKYAIELKDVKLYDHVYLANWCYEILYNSSIQDEKHLILFISDVIKKENDLIFNRWYADMARKGIPIDWKEMI